MNIRADLHLHTVLSPCGDLDMSPRNIIRAARERGLKLIGITDHNSTRQAAIIRDLGREQGIHVLTGAEVTTQEEIHCVVFLPDDCLLREFQAYLDAHLPDIPNDPDKFGYQVVADPDDNILYEEPRLLLSALNQPIEKIERKVHELQGIFIPAHIDKPRFSILSQLGFIPPDLPFDALELSPHTSPEQFLKANKYLNGKPFIQSSDAHYLEDIGKVSTLLQTPDFTFEHLRTALHNLARP